MKYSVMVISIISAAAVVALAVLPKKARSKRATFAELYKDNICDLDGLFG